MGARDAYEIRTGHNKSVSNPGQIRLDARSLHTCVRLPTAGGGSGRRMWEGRGHWSSNGQSNNPAQIRANECGKLCEASMLQEWPG